MEPFSKNRTETLASLGELRLLDLIREWLGDAMPPFPAGMGDDCAVLPVGANLITTDSVVRGRHFDDSVPPERVGAKLLKRNLSDIAAMGGRPREAVMAGLFPPNLRIHWLERFTRGLAACARAHGVHLVGGDLTQTEDFLGANLTLLGHASKPVLRRGARPEDTIWVTGELGGSLLGHHVDFIPRLTEGIWLARHGAVRSMIDVTDGLAKDLPALLEEGQSVALDLDVVPVREAALRMAEKTGRPALHHAFTDGEDYELCFVLDSVVDPEAFAQAFAAALPQTRLTCLGTVVPRGRQGTLRDAEGRSFEPGQGYGHF